MGQPAAILVDPFLGKFSRLDIFQQILHGLSDLGADNLLSPGKIPILRSVANRIAHISQTTLVDEIHDQLDFVHALKIRHLRWITRVHQGLISRLDQGREPAAQDRLLAKKISLGFIFKGSFNDRRPSTAQGLGIGQPHLLGIAGWILMYGEKTGHAPPLFKLTAHEMAWPFRGNHKDIDPGGRNDPFEMNIKPMAKGQIVPTLQSRTNFLFVNLSLEFIGQENHDDISNLSSLSGLHDLEARLFRLGPRATFPLQPHHYLDSRIPKVIGVGMALAAIAKNSYPLPFKMLQIRVLVIVDLH